MTETGVTTKFPQNFVARYAETHLRTLLLKIKGPVGATPYQFSGVFGQIGSCKLEVANWKFEVKTGRWKLEVGLIHINYEISWKNEACLVISHEQVRHRLLSPHLSTLSQSV